MKLKDLVEIGSLPRGGQTVYKKDENPNFLNKAITLENFRKLKYSEQLNETKTLLPEPNPEWIYVKSTKQWFGYKDSVYLFQSKSTGFKKYQLDDSQLMLIEHISILSPDEAELKEEKTIMAEWDELLNAGGVSPIGAGTGVPTGDVTTSNAFEGVNKPVLTNEAVRAEISKNGAVYQKDVISFNRQQGFVVGFITDKDTVVGVRGKSKYQKKGDRYVVKPGTPQEAVDQIRDLETAKKKAGLSALLQTHGIKEVMLELVNKAPEKIKGAVIAIPRGGYLPPDKMLSSDVLQPNTSDTELVYILVDIEYFYYFVGVYFGGEIKESKEVAPWDHGYYNSDAEKGSVEKIVVLQKKFEKKVEGSDVPKVVWKPVLKAQGRPTVITPVNYFPVATYDYMNITKTVEEKTANLMNQVLFGKIFGDAAPDSILVEGQAKLFSKENGVIKSKWISSNPSFHEVPEVKPYHGFGQLKEVLIPLKQEVPKAKEEGTRLIFRKSSLIQESKDSSLNFHSLANPNFKVFVEACHGTLTEAQITSIVRKPRKGKGNDDKAAKVISGSNLFDFYAKVVNTGEVGDAMSYSGEALSIDKFRDIFDRA